MFMRKFFSVVVVGSLFMFCGNENPVVNESGAVHNFDTGDSPYVSYSNDGDGTPPYDTWVAAVTTAPDYSASDFEIIFTGDWSASGSLIPQLHTDAAVRASGRDVYILERMGKDNVVKYDSKLMGVFYQEAVGVGLNIQDIAVVSGTKAYISALADPNLIVFNPGTGKEISKIDLSRFNTYAGTDSALTHPYVGALAYHNGYVYAACQRLDEFFGLGDTSLIAVIDAVADTVAGSIKLVKRNPASLSVFGGRLLVSSQGDWMDVGGADAGVEAIDLATNTNLGVVVEGGALGGNPSGVIYISADKAYVSVMSADFSTSLFSFNPVSGAAVVKVAGIGDASGGLAYDGWRVYAGDRDFTVPGVAVVNPSTDAVERKISTGMPPSSLAAVSESSVSVRERPRVIPAVSAAK